MRTYGRKVGKLEVRGAEDRAQGMMIQTHVKGSGKVNGVRNGGGFENGRQAPWLRKTEPGGRGYSATPG